MLVLGQPTSDPTQDTIVLNQTPTGGSQAKPGSTVTITVAHYVATNGNGNGNGNGGGNGNGNGGGGGPNG